MKRKNVATDTDETKVVSFSAVSNYKKSKNSITWILDSGASKYLTKNENHLRNVKLLSKSIKICIAKAGITLTASKVGTISCTTIGNGKESPLTMFFMFPDWNLIYYLYRNWKQMVLQLYLRTEKEEY